MDNSIMNKNIEELKKYYPKIAVTMESYIKDNKITDRAFVDVSVDGNYIAGIVDNGRDWYMNSRYYPEKAAKDWAEQYEKVNYQTLFIILGLANGMYIRELLSKLEDTNIILLYEPNAELLALIIQYVDISDIIRDKRVWLVVGDININLLTEFIVININYSNMRLMEYVSLPSYGKIYVRQWHDVIEKIKDKVTSIVLNRNTQILYKYEVIENIFSNYQDAIEQYTINQIKDKMKDVNFDEIPAILVAAGPSLDKNIDELKKAKGKAFIIGVDTALNTMAKHGIIPDISITIDPHKPVSLFQAECMANVPMIVSVTSNSDVITILSGKRFYMGERGYINYLYKKYNKQTPAMLETGGSVANNAFSFLQYLGFKRIILVGQDLAYTGNMGHTSGAYEGEDNQVNESGKHSVMLDAVGGGKVLSNDVMRAYNIWFENQIERYSYLEVINATEGGAVKRGSIEMTLSEAISEYCKCKCDFKGRIETIETIFTVDEQSGIHREFNNIGHDIDICREKIKEGIKNYDTYLELNKKNDIYGKKYKKVLKEIESINGYADREPIISLASIYNARDDFEVQAEVYDIKEDGMEEASKIHSLGVKMLKSYDRALIDMKEDIRYLSESATLNKFVKRLRDVLKYLDFASYEYRKQNIYKASIEYINFSNWIKYIITIYMNRHSELESYGVKFNLKGVLKNISQINSAIENKDYIYATDILQYSLKPILLNTMMELVCRKLVPKSNDERENIELIKMMDPWLHSQIMNREITGHEYAEEYTSYGYTTLKRIGENNFYLHTNQNPRLETRIQFENITLQNDDIAIVGLGAGYILEELKDRKYKGNIYVFETDMNVIRVAIKNINLRHIYMNCRIKLVYDPFLKIFSEALKKKDVDIFFHSPSIRNIENEEVRKIIGETQMNINSVREQSDMLRTNLKKNLCSIEKTLDEEKDSICNKDVICVAAGASLDRDIEELKDKAKCEDVVIIAVGTVYKKLRNAGIIPEYVLITDAKETMKNQITDVDSTGTKLLYLSTVDKSVVDTWKGEKRIVFQNGMDGAELYALRHKLITVDTGGSVSTTAISIAARLGASRVVCVGLDLAFINGYTHASGTNAKKIENNEKMRKVKSVNGEEIPTYTNLDIYRHWIERYIKDIDNVEFINCSGGAYIEGMKHMNLKDL